MTKGTIYGAVHGPGDCHWKIGPRKYWSGGPIFHGILVRGTNFFMENWSYAENFGPTMDQFSMEYWSGGPIFHGILVRGTNFSWNIGPWNIGPGDQFFHGILVRKTNIFIEYWSHLEFCPCHGHLHSILVPEDQYSMKNESRDQLSMKIGPPRTNIPWKIGPPDQNSKNWSPGSLFHGKLVPRTNIFADQNFRDRTIHGAADGPAGPSTAP